MNVLAALILGVVIGWLIEWGIDWFFWRPKNDALTAELADTRSQLTALEIGASPADNQMTGQIASLEESRRQLTSSNSELNARIAGLETEKAALLATVAELGSENEDLHRQMDTQVASLKDDFQEIYGVGPVIEGKLNEAGIYKFRQLAALDPDEFRSILGPETERPVNEEKIIALAALAARASENVRGDDLQAVKGVGPVIAGILNQAGVYTYADLGGLTPEQLEAILGEDVQRLADEAAIIQQAQILAGQRTATEPEAGSAELQARLSSLEMEKADLLILVSELRSENEVLQGRMDTQIAGLKDDLQEIYGVGPVVEGKLNTAGIYKFRDLANLDPDEFRKILGPGSERAINEEKVIALAGLAARATEDVRGEDLQAVRGVGPVIAGLLNQAGVYTYADLGRQTPEQIQAILGEYTERLSDEEDIIQQARQLAGMDS